MTDIAADMPPASLYKYRWFDKGREGGQAYDWDRAIIVGCSLWAGSPLFFNDPFDCYPVVDFDGTQQEKAAWAAQVGADNRMSEQQVLAIMENALRNPAARALMTDWRSNLAELSVLSLTEEPDDMLMWAHYANSHKGYCLELDATVPPLSFANRVRYVPERPTFRLFDPNKAEKLMHMLLNKADFWEHEHEWRMVRPIEQGPLIFPPEGLKSIIFGAGIMPDDEAALRAMANERAVPVVFKRAKLDNRNYRLEIVED